MNPATASSLKGLAPGIILALLTILFGFGLGGAFGAAEDSIKSYLNGSAEAVFESVYGGDSGKKEAVVQKSWAYMKRAHLHGGAIGAAALGAIFVLCFFGAGERIEKLSAIAFGAGALIYSVFWLFAALKAPGLGSTHDAKEALKFLAIPGAGLCLLGLTGTFFVVVRRLLGEDRG